MYFTSCKSFGFAAFYGEFMSRLSGAIFQWDPEDIAKLIEAKRSSLGPNYRSVPDHDVS